MTNIFTYEHGRLIIGAIKNGSVDDLKYFIIKYKDYDSFSLVFGYETKLNPLILCCYYGRFKMIDFLLKINEVSNNINFQDNYGYTALIFASFYCDKYINGLKIIDLLIKYGADLNIKNKNKRNALFYFLRYCNFDIHSWNIVEKMLDFGSDVYFNIYECLDDYLNRKTKFQNTEFIKLLIMFGYDLK